MPQKLDLDRVALILVEAVFFGEKTTAQRWGVHHNTIVNYRKRLDEDVELVNIFNLKKQAFESEWASEIPASIRAGIRFLGEAAKQADPKSPEAIHAVAGAVKILAEVGLTKEILDVRLDRHNREGREESRPLATIPATVAE